ncbi:MAG: hypothetical protein U0441_30495 [Polyangiaceae bacterium]
MADPYIDPWETQIYGKHACEQIEAICIGRIPKLDGMLKFARDTQAEANAATKAVLDKQPKAAPGEDAATLLAEARDSIVRFASYLNSLKGQPVPLSAFFHRSAPSEVARRRLVKLAAAVTHIADEIPKHDAIADKTWGKDFTSLAKRMGALKSDQHAAKVEKIDLGPEMTKAREDWLATYNANKALVRGFLMHAGKLSLMPLVFDDLAEVHHLAGVSDEPPPDANAATSGANASSDDTTKPA